MNRNLKTKIEKKEKDWKRVGPKPCVLGPNYLSPRSAPSLPGTDRRAGPGWQSPGASASAARSHLGVFFPAGSSRCTGRRVGRLESRIDGWDPELVAAAVSAPYRTWRSAPLVQQNRAMAMGIAPHVSSTKTIRESRLGARQGCFCAPWWP